MTFIERPHQNKKKSALAYVSKLLEDAINSKENRAEDIKELEDIQKLLSRKKYGLVWEQHTEKFEEDMEIGIPIFLEEKHKRISSFSNYENYNFLLEGENLHSLHLLEKTHKGKVDIIYIDPPYNTGNKDFFYNDDFVAKDDEFKHSKWLSFMERRLTIAKRILSQEGLIFISIDDNEQSQLKMLMDEIFGQEGFIANIAVETSNGLFGVKAKHINKKIVKSKDYLLVYANAPEKLNLKPLYTKSKNAFDTHFTIYKTDEVEMTLSEFIKENSLFIKRSKQLNVNNSIQNIGLLMDSFDDIKALILTNASNIYRLRDYTLKIPEKYNEDYEKGEKIKIDDYFIFKNKNGKPVYMYPFSRLVKKTDDYTSIKASSVIVGDFWKGFHDDMGNVGKEGGVKLSNGKKPIRLLKNILKMINKKDALILDFFAGSGTTAHAVLELNKEDGGNRKFIIATNDEVIDITYKRMKNINQKLPMNLKYFKTDFIDKQADNLENSLLNNVKTLIELKYGIDLANSDVAIVTKRSALKKPDISALSTIYMRSQTHKMLNRQELEELKDIKIIDIPETFFPLEMREAGL